MGLKVTINTDEHKNKFINSKNDKEGSEHNFIVRDSRYWGSLKIVEKYFNEKFTKLGIKKNNIINTYSVQELQSFFKKQ